MNRTNYEQSEHRYRQAIQILTGLIDKANLNLKPVLIDSLLTDQVGAYLGLGCLLKCRDQGREAMEHQEKAHDLTKKPTTSKDSSPGHQNRLRVILTMQGEILIKAKTATPEDRRRGLEKLLMAVEIYRRLSQTTAGMGRERILRRFVESLFFLADTFENLELHAESQGALQEAQSIVKISQMETLPSSLHQHQQGFASIKETKNARRDLDQHTSTLHVGSKICLHGLLTQGMNGRERDNVVYWKTNGKINNDLQ